MNGQAILPRSHLRTALLNTHCRLSLLCAPAGSGKTMLLDECLAYRPANTRLARLDLQDHPIEATQVIARMGAALQLMNADFDRLGEVLTKTVQPLWLVLDGYPSLPDADLDRLVKELIQSSSPRVRWWITTRNRPKMQLARMLLNGELFELDARRLAKKPKYKTT